MATLKICSLMKKIEIAELSMYGQVKKYCRLYTSVFEIKTPVNSILWKVLWRAAVAFGSVDRKLYM
jgi:hypothetical protein